MLSVIMLNVILLYAKQSKYLKDHICDSRRKCELSLKVKVGLSMGGSREALLKGRDQYS